MMLKKGLLFFEDPDLCLVIRKRLKRFYAAGIITDTGVIGIQQFAIRQILNKVFIVL